MMRPPHKLLAGIWRDADAVIGVVGALRDAEQAVAPLTTNPAAPLAGIAAIAWAFEAPDGRAAIARSLARLRGTEMPSARRVYRAPPSGRGPGIRRGVRPDGRHDAGRRCGRVGPRR